MKVLLALFLIASNGYATLFSEKISDANLTIKATDSSKDKIRKYIKDNRDILGADTSACNATGKANSICEQFNNESFKKEKLQIEQEIMNVAKANNVKNETDLIKTELSSRSFLPGAIVQSLNNLKLNGWVGDFKNTTYAAKDYEKIKIPVSLFVTDAFMNSEPYAMVSMDHGWMITAAESDKIAISEKNRIKKITIFSDATISGTTLNLWAKAVSLGGLDILKILKKKNEYKDHWAYVYFDSQDNTICSSNIECHLQDPRKREIKIQWKGKQL